MLYVAGEGRRRPTPQLKHSGGSSPLFSRFVLFRSSTDWMMPTHTREGDLLYSVYQFEC